jgi:hypothetical protein
MENSALSYTRLDYDGLELAIKRPEKHDGLRPFVLKKWKSFVLELPQIY